MGDENPIRTLGDYSKPSHEGYRNTIELPVGNNVVPLRSDTIWERSACFIQFSLTRSASNWLKQSSSGTITTCEESYTRIPAQFLFHQGRTTAKLLRNDILMFQQVPHHVSFHLKYKINRAAGGKLHNKNTDESWEIIENLALYDHEGWDETKEFVKPVKAISTPQGVPKTPERRLLELEDQINFLLKQSQLMPTSSSAHTPQAYVNVVHPNSRPRNQNEPPKLNTFAFRECTGPSPQPQALEPTFEARVRDYMAAHTKRMKRFKNAIFKQREEINIRMTKMFELLKELTTSRTPEKVLIREEAKFPVAKNVNSISMTKSGTRVRKKKGNMVKSEFLEPDGQKGINALVDQGSDVNVMPYTTYMKLTDERPAETDIRLSLASHSYIYPLGIAEDVLVEVAEHVYPIDFVILDIKENEKRPFILGTPFLTTAKATIRFDKGTITLRSGKSKVSFHRIPDPLCMTDKGVKNDIEPIAPTMTVNRLVLEWEEKIKLHMEKEMKFNQWRSKSFKGKHPTLMATKEEIDDEGEVT
ncbi:zinc finger, CCHC-type containing protein [Tanacetum coccineum]